MIPVNLTKPELRASKSQLLTQYCRLVLEQKKAYFRARKIRRVKQLEKEISEIADDIDLIDEELSKIIESNI